MRTLSLDQQVRCIAALVEGNSIRSTERMVSVHRDTIVRLLLMVGIGCRMLHDRTMRDLRSSVIELDEIWAYCAKKQARVKDGDPAWMGDAYTFVAIDANAKAVLSYRTGKRTLENAIYFLKDLRSRVLGAPQISSDGWASYPEAVEIAFGADVDYGIVLKTYAREESREGEARYSPPRCVASVKRIVSGAPNVAKINTSFVERQNLTIRMGMRRLTRLTNGFSKRLPNLEAAMSLHFAFYNLCRVHETLRVTPAMQVGAEDHIWSVPELVESALSCFREWELANIPELMAPSPPTPPQRPVLRLLQGGVS